MFINGKWTNIFDILKGESKVGTKHHLRILCLNKLDKDEIWRRISKFSFQFNGVNFI